MNKKSYVLLFLIVGFAILSLDAARSQWQSVSKKSESMASSSAMVEQVSDAMDMDTAAEEDETGDPLVVRDPQEAEVERDFSDAAKDKRKAVVRLVNRAVAYVKKQPISDAMRKFTQTKEFIDGELYLYVYNEKGVCFANGQQTSQVWSNMYELRDIYGTPIIQDVLNKAKKGGGWITYNWRNATKVAYIKQVEKDGKKYAIGCGYYPHSKEDAVVNLVIGAVALFKKMVANKEPREDAFSSLSYPIGRFVSGDLYLYALDFQGNIFAQGDRPGLIGTNSLDYKDIDGKLVNQEIIRKLKERPDEGVWVEYKSKRAKKRAYAERVVDAKGVNYFIACGYYPEENKDMAIDLVKKGYQYMKAHGKGLAAKDFTDRQNNTYRFGGLYLVVYDLKGKCIADGGNPENVGTNQWESTNDTGKKYVQEIIQQGIAGGGWVDFRIRNSFESVYVDRIDMGIDEYVISCGIFPANKNDTVSLLVKSATSFLGTHLDEIAFDAFGHSEPLFNFIRGDLSIFVINNDGLCFVSGDDYNLIWQNILGAKDDDGKPYVKMFIDKIKNGAGSVTYKINGAYKTAYLEKVVKDNVEYIVGSSYYK